MRPTITSCCRRSSPRNRSVRSCARAMRSGATSCAGRSLRDDQRRRTRRHAGQRRRDAQFRKPGQSGGCSARKASSERRSVSTTTGPIRSSSRSATTANSFDRNVGAGSPLGIARGQNALVGRRRPAVRAADPLTDWGAYVADPASSQSCAAGDALAYHDVAGTKRFPLYYEFRLWAGSLAEDGLVMSRKRRSAHCAAAGLPLSFPTSFMIPRRAGWLLQAIVALAARLVRLGIVRNTIRQSRSAGDRVRLRLS